MKPPVPSRPWPLLAVVAAAATVHAALALGGLAYTKRFETSLLAEPSPLAAAGAKVPFGTELRIQETKGPWLRVQAGTSAGWVFAANVSETRLPAEVHGPGLTAVAASQTTATAAARGLYPSAADYAVRHNLHSAEDDLAWMVGQSDAIQPADVARFMQENRKGDFQ